MPIVKYFSQYHELFTMELEPYPPSFPLPYIWQCWLQGEEHAPPVVQACLQSVRTYHGQPSHVGQVAQVRQENQKKIKVLNARSVHDYVEIPKHIQEKYVAGHMSDAHYSDYLRVALLAKYGGVWVDATVFLSAPLPSYIFSQDFFAFKFPPWCALPALPSKEQVFSAQTRAIDRRCFSNWLLQAKPNTRYILLIKKFLELYWLRETQAFDYFFFHLFCTYALLHDAQCVASFARMPSMSNAYPHILQQYLAQPFDGAVFARVLELSAVHKLTYKELETVQPHSFAAHVLALACERAGEKQG